MAVSIITDWTILQNEAAIGATATLPTFSAGTNRIVEIAVCAYNGSGNASTATSAVANSQNATLIDAQTAAVDRVAVGIYQFLESQISSINGQTLTTAGASGGQKTVLYRVLGGCRQDAVTAFNKAYSAVTSTLTMPLTRAADSFTTVVSFSYTNAQDLTSTNPSRDGALSLTSGRRINYGSEADTANTSNTTVSGTSRTSSVVWNREQTPAQLITSINSGAGVKIGSTGNVAQTTGFASAPETVTIGSLTGTVTAYNSGNGDTTFSVPSPTHEDVYQDINSTQTVTLSNGSESAFLSGVPFTAPVGSTVVTVASPVLDDPRYFAYWLNYYFGITAVNGDKFYGIDADVTWAADTGGSAESLPVTTPVVYWDASTNTTYLLDLTVTPFGVSQAVAKNYYIGFGIGIGF